MPKLAIEMVGEIVSPGDRVGGTSKATVLSSGSAELTSLTGTASLMLFPGLPSTTAPVALATRRM